MFPVFRDRSNDSHFPSVRSLQAASGREFGNRFHSRVEGAHDGGSDDGDGDNVPLPLDHFFFCFLPPVAEGACHEYILVLLLRRIGRRGIVGSPF